MTPARSVPRVGGFTLIELMIVLAIIAIVSSMGLVRYRRVFSQAEEIVGLKQLREIFEAIQMYEQTHGDYPATLDDLGLGPLLDPWGNPYQYANFANAAAPGNAPAGGGAGAPKGKGSGKADPAQDPPGGQGAGVGMMRKDRFLVPINTHFDLYSMGPDGRSQPPLTAAGSLDDLIVANDGEFIGVARCY